MKNPSLTSATKSGSNKAAKLQELANIYENLYASQAQCLIKNMFSHFLKAGVVYIRQNNTSVS